MRYRWSRIQSVAVFLSVQAGLVTCLGAAPLKPGDVLVLTGGAPHGLYRVDPITGATSLFSGPAQPGPGWNIPSGLADGGSVLYAGERGHKSIYRINKNTGSRGVLSGPDTTIGDTWGFGPAFQEISGIAVLDSGPFTRLFVTDSARKAVIDVDNKGNRTIVSDAVTGTGPALAGPVDIELVKSEAFWSVVVLDSGRLIRLVGSAGTVALDREVFSDDVHGTGPLFMDPIDLVGDPIGNMYVADYGLNAIFQVDLITGNRSIISSDTVGAGPQLDGLFAISTNGDGTIVAGINHGTLIRIDVQTGNRSLLAQPTPGFEPYIDVASDVLVLPVPEPATLGMALVGGAALVVLTRGTTKGRLALQTNPTRDR